MLEKIQETAAFIKAKMHTQPETAIILGTGLGSLVQEITDAYEINYSDIPNFPVSTVEGHKGKLIFGKLGNSNLSGTCHARTWHQNLIRFQCSRRHESRF